MKEVADYLRQTIKEVGPSLRAISEEEASSKPQPHKWSKKEILGHLIDSASNNQHKFVRAMAQSHLDFVGYAQDMWVSEQKYNATNWQELITFWFAYNSHIAHIIEHVNPAYLANTITIEGNGLYTLQFIMEDYVKHLKHHLKAILHDNSIQSKFANIYNV